MTEISESTKAKAGWYADPRWPGEVRRWDGTRWIDEWRPPALPLSRRPEGVMLTGICLGIGLGIVAGICFEVDKGLGWVVLWVASSVAGTVFTAGVIAKAVEIGVRAARR